MSHQPPRRRIGGWVAPPTCLICGAILPHDHPSARYYHTLQLDIRLYENAVALARALGRPFEEHEVFQPAWDAGRELMPALDPGERFELFQEGSASIKRLWRLKNDGGTDGNH